MRSIIFQDTGPSVLQDANGHILQLSTGSDGFAEHNVPENKLYPKICSVIRYEGSRPTDQDILESFRITRGDFLQFARLPTAQGQEPEAVVGFSFKKVLTDESVLQNLCYQSGDIAAALHTGDFAVRVRTTKLVEALAAFYQDIVAGHVVMAPGSKLGPEPHGLVLVNTRLLTQDQIDQLARDVVDHLRRHRQIRW